MGRMRRVARWASWGLGTLLFGALLALWVWLPDRLVFPAHLAPPSAPAAVPGTRAVSIEVPGADLEGLHWQGDARLASEPLLLVFAGNAMNAEDLGAMVAELFPRHEVVAVNYRGYGRSTGRVDTGVFLPDALAVRAGIPKEREVVVIGASIGSAAGAHVAMVHGDPAVLITPFDSLGAVFADRLPGSGFWLRTNLSPGADLAKGQAPVFLLFAAQDEIFGPDQEAALRARAQGVVGMEVLPETGHNTVYGHPDFAATLAGAVAQVRATAGAKAR